MSAETPGTDHDDTEALAALLEQRGETEGLMWGSLDLPRETYQALAAVAAAYVASKAERAERERDEARAVIERVTAQADEVPADAFWKASVAGTVERDRGGYYGRGFRDGYGRAQADLRAALAPATHVHQCASAGYPGHEPCSSCLCVCGERFDGMHTEPEGVGTGAGGGAPRQDTGSAWDNRSEGCPEDPAQAHPLTLDEHLAEVERRIEERRASAPRGAQFRAMTAVLDVAREYRESL